MKNKRSLFIVVAMVLLLAVVIGMGGTTFAKYISKSDNVTNEARVAKWGYTFSATTDLFGKEYTKGTTYAEVVADNGVAVVAEDLVVAPGTAGEMTFTINPNGSEVLTQITFDVADGYTDIYLEDYHPLVWTLNGTKAGTNGTMAELVTALEALTYVIEPETTTPTEVEIAWSWEFSNGHDVEDTALGVKAQAGTTEGTTLSFTFTGTATQIQAAP